MRTRQSTLERLVYEYWRTGKGTAGTDGGRAAYDEAQRKLAGYVAKNIEHITIASDPPKPEAAP